MLTITRKVQRFMSQAKNPIVSGAAAARKMRVAAIMAASQFLEYATQPCAKMQASIRQYTA